MDDLVGLMRAAVGTGRIDTVEGDHSPEAMNRPRVKTRTAASVRVSKGGFPCLVCGTEVARAELAGRNLYWCPQCQPEGSTGGAQ